MHNQVSLLEWFESTHTLLCNAKRYSLARQALHNALSYYGIDADSDIHIWMVLERMLERQMLIELSNNSEPELWS